jgi:hypothetical protein
MTRAEIIIQAREKEHLGDFKRRIVDQTPVSLLGDEVVLSCGHRFNQPGTARVRRDELNCAMCALDWVNEQLELWQLPKEKTL